MLRHTAILTTLLLTSAGPAVAQNPGGVGQVIGDFLSDVLGDEQRTIRAHIVLATPAELIVRTGNGRTYSVDTSALAASDWRNLEPGQAVTLAAKRGTRPDTLVATSIQPDPSAPNAPYRVVRGTVQSLNDAQATLRTADGGLLTFDITAVPAASRPARGESVAIAYDAETAYGRRTALWIQHDTTATAQPAASPPTGSGYERIRGYVQAISVSSLTLRRDTGETITVDTSGLDAQAVASTRPGDVVSVVGRMTGSGFRAEVLREE